jgi:hypothetical protein
MASTAPAAPPALDARVRAACTFLERLFPAPREFAIRLWRAPSSGRREPVFTLVVTAPGVLRAMFRPPVETSLGDAFVSGALEVEGDLTAAFPIVETCRRAARSPRQLFELVRLWRALPPIDTTLRAMLRRPPTSPVVRIPPSATVMPSASTTTWGTISTRSSWTRAWCTPAATSLLARVTWKQRSG